MLLPKSFLQARLYASDYADPLCGPFPHGLGRLPASDGRKRLQHRSCEAYASPMAIPDSATARSRSVPQITARLPLCRSTRMKKLSRSSGLKRYRALPKSRIRRTVSAPRGAAHCFSRRECLPTGWLCPAWLSTSRSTAFSEAASSADCGSNGTR